VAITKLVAKTYRKRLSGRLARLGLRKNLPVVVDFDRNLEHWKGLHAKRSCLENQAGRLYWILIPFASFHMVWNKIQLPLFYPASMVAIFHNPKERRVQQFHLPAYGRKSSLSC
jgi:hypothetical protein